MAATMTIPLDQATVDRAVEFHGHMCPGLALGIQASRLALREVGRRTDQHDVAAVVETNYCAVDAVQSMMGCTFGLVSLVHRDHGKNVFTFFDRTNGRAVRIAARSPFQPGNGPAAEELVRRVGAGQATAEETQHFWEMMRERTRQVLDASPDDLFTVEEVHDTPPAKPWIHPVVTCDECGEGAMETRIRHLDGRHLCIPCFQERTGSV